MAVRFVTAGSGLTRSGAYFDPTQSWTRTLWVNLPTHPSSGFWTVWEIFGPTTSRGVGSYAYEDVPGFVLDLEWFITTPAGFEMIQILPPSAGAWFFAAWRYDAAQLRMDLLINGTVVGSTGVNMGLTPPSVTDRLGVSSSLLIDLLISYDGVWQVALTDAEIAGQMRSRQAVRTAGLLRFTPLESASALGTFTAVGTLETVAGPLPVERYTTTTLSAARQVLADRLMDSTFVRWTEAELTVYLQQSLRTWNAFTAFYRERGAFDTTMLQAFYDLPTELPDLRGQTYTVGDAIREICFHLIEELPSGSTWNGTRQFTPANITDAITQARDAFLLETGVVQTRSLVSVTPVPLDGRLELSEAIVNLRRAAWTTADGIGTVLKRDDEWSLMYYARSSWPVQGALRPRVYSVGETPPLVVQIAPIPTTGATLDLLTVNRGAGVSFAATDVSLGVPNDFAWVVVFGALNILLNKDGIAFDPARADYCRARWDQGIMVAKNAPVVLDGRIGSASCAITSVADADAYASDWQLVPGNPKRILTAGVNVVALWPPPGVPVGGGAFTVTMDMVRNAPVPIESGDFLQAGPELLETLYDYAQHLALFKEGHAQIAQSKDLLDRFLAMTKTEVKIEWALSPNRQAAISQQTQDERVMPYQTTNEGTIN